MTPEDYNALVAAKREMAAMNLQERIEEWQRLDKEWSLNNSSGYDHAMRLAFLTFSDLLAERDKLAAENSAFREVFGLNDDEKIVSGHADGTLLIDTKGGSRRRLSLTSKEAIALKAENAALRERLNKSHYLCERCGGTGEQPKGCWNPTAKDYSATAGKCESCDGIGYLGCKPSRQEQETLNEMLRLSKRLAEAEAKLADR